MDFVVLTEKPIRIGDFLEAAKQAPHCGARLWFEGIVRNENAGKKVEGIFYEAYAAMAEKELKRIVETTRARWPLGSLGIVHRTGKVKVGEIGLLVVVQAPHRKEALEALQFVINEIKKKVPIWKKEFYEEEDGCPIGRWQEPSVWQQ